MVAGDRVLHSITYLALQAREGWAAAAGGGVQQASDGVGGLRL